MREAAKRRGYFEGWYFKQQGETGAVALIPAIHRDKAGTEASASLQVITDEASYNIDLDPAQCRWDRKAFVLRHGNCVFSERGCVLDVRTGDCRLQGTLRFGPLAKPAYDFMGPFRFVPRMECIHSVISLLHQVEGTLTVNGKAFVFQKGRGYIEGDRGRSFPQRYLWTQCCWGGNSLMLSAADIPLWGLAFTGCVGFVYINGKERRIATYCGAKLRHIGGGAVTVTQGDLTLEVTLLESRPHPLRAPLGGGMTRTIHESAACRVHYICRAEGKTLFDIISDQASFENNWV